MTKLTFYGGVGEIGGNKILLEDGDTRIFFDFGQSFDFGKDYFVSWLKPRWKKKGCKDLFEFGLLPEIKGLYGKKMLENCNKLKYVKPKFDAVFLSHAHFDHIAHIKFVDPSIPVYLGHGTKKFVEAQEETSSYSDYGKHDYRTFKTGDSIEVGDITVEPMHVDHSIPGSYGFVIHTSAGPIVYTGDFRRHGTMSHLTEDFITKATAAEPVAMITEGTRVVPKETRKLYTEPDVLNKGTKIVKKCKDLAIVTSYSRDIDRFRTMYNIALRNNRTFVISAKTAYLFDKVRKKLDLPDPRKDDNMRIYFKEKKSGTYCEKDYYKWERDYLDNMITEEEVGKRQGDYLMHMSFYQFAELIDIQPRKGSVFIHSMSEPFSEEDMEDDVMHNWVDHFGLKFCQLHASGHCSKEEMFDIIETVGAKKVFPIHTEHAEMFNRLNNRVLIPNISEVYEI